VKKELVKKENETEKKIVVQGGVGDPVAMIEERIRIIRKVQKKVMKPDTDYGLIPGCGKKPALFKSGAEKLAATFQLAPKMHVEKEWIDLDGLKHLNIDVRCDIYNIKGEFLGSGVGSCSSMENKYRYRDGVKYLDEPIPKDYKSRKAEYKEKGFGCKKDESGQWQWCKFEGKEINKDIADIYNTILKMAKKRAFIDATLTVTGVSDIFTQDIEEQGRMEKTANGEEWELTKEPVDSTYWKAKHEWPGYGHYKGDDGKWYFKRLKKDNDPIDTIPQEAQK